MRFLFFLLTSLIIISCEKIDNTPAPPSSASGLIQYKVNGQLVIIDNADSINGASVSIAKQLKGYLPDTRYLLHGQKGVEEMLIASMVTDSLKKDRYHYDSAYMHAAVSGTFTLTYHGDGCIIYFKDDYFEINITSFKNGRVTGNFSAKLTPLTGILDYGSGGSVIVSDGLINNVSVSY
jgi:hypothetical protein